MGAKFLAVFKAFRVLREPDLYRMVLRIYFPILFPLTFVITQLALWLDGILGWGPLPLGMAALPLATGLFVLGALIWVNTYDTLVYDGDGSPSPAVRRTQRLVTHGIYAYCRNPSIHGKLLGFLAIGVAVASPIFCFVLAPLLLTSSLIEKLWRQEPMLVDIFGEEYLAYRARVPLFFPFPKRKAASGASSTAGSSRTPSIRPEGRTL